MRAKKWGTWLGLSLLGLSSLLPGCRTTTPEASFQHLQKTLARRDFDGLYELLSRKSRNDFKGYVRRMEKGVRARLESQGLDPDEIRDLPTREAFVQIISKSVELEPEIFAEITGAVLVDPPEVFGPFALIRYRSPEGGSLRMIEFVEEKGEWKLHDFEP